MNKKVKDNLYCFYYKNDKSSWDLLNSKLTLSDKGNFH